MTGLTDKQIDLLKGLNFGVIATVAENGRLQTSVVWVDTDGENVLVNTTNKRAKGRNLRANPRVSISVWDNETPTATSRSRARWSSLTQERTSTSTSSRAATRARTSTRRSTA